ncbi:DNA primase [Bowmanella yangjiangensis]|uniref:DNA primase n=1 Tax=Bowmanella yangjiangensis TaxID=2811230 RepID=A0ABS3CTE2_9ALTE|nr:DNA primase [Bowmanella yangjiangensis]MBN7820325.1 DNA primase [Bowmanella yangjiangensis]
MAGLIPRDFIDDLLARTDIVELVDSRVRLKKAGRNYQACCPFHNEKSPSFTVSQDKQFYHCFGCGAHGNAISFLMEYDRLEFPEAIEELARYQGVEVPREQGNSPQQSKEKRQQQENDYELMEKVARFFVHQLKHHSNGSQAIDYLKQRGLSGDIVKQFNIGYAPSDWDAALKTFGRTPALQQQLLDLKVISENEQRRRFDFFRDRIMFPIRDRRGRVVGFGGRVMGDGGPKYLNSPETRIFHKGHELYGFYQARQANRKLERLMIVEGYMDVVALAQFGIDYAVASLGTATTAEHIQLLFRAAPQLVCCYDGDRAGRDAAWRALENALPYLKDGVEMKFLFLPDGEDPDTLVRKLGKEAFEQQLESAVPLSKFFFDSLMSRHHTKSNEGKAALKAEAMPLLASIPECTQKKMLEDQLNEYTLEDKNLRLKREIEEAFQRHKPRQVDNQLLSKHSWTPIRLLLRLLLEEPSLAAKYPELAPSALGKVPISGLDVLQQVHEDCLANPHYKTPHLLERFRGHKIQESLSKLMTMDLPVDDSNPLEDLYRDGFDRLINLYLQTRCDELLAKARLGTISMEEKRELNNLMRDL